MKEEKEEVLSRLEQLESKVSQLLTLRQEGAETANYQEVHLNEVQRIVLNQNTPNPFRERTSITYFLPEVTENAMLFIFNVDGKILKKVDLQPGEGILEVYASNLSSGIYTYSISVDGKIIDTKRMMVSK
ncbi:MAG: T9SS type A sorting domain-containing protein [Phaeodactylibacter sp.]|nr:T9SS type A sorting domain-containing protein [Phaeodactylibacter sp.]MCB9053475.1 T9SS type A sorting domain-containing protein [Lewinellaceae bacterium]